MRLRKLTVHQIRDRVALLKLKISHSSSPFRAAARQRHDLQCARAPRLYQDDDYTLVPGTLGEEYAANIFYKNAIEFYRPRLVKVGDSAILKCNRLDPRFFCARAFWTLRFRLFSFAALTICDLSLQDLAVPSAPEAPPRARIRFGLEL
jgi:hypothetical protein